MQVRWNAVLYCCLRSSVYRTRKIKCDETKPFCRKCAKSGRKCDGYPVQTPIRTSSSSRTLLAPGSASTSRAPSPAPPDAYAIPFKIPGSQKDRRLFHYFCVEVSTHLSGYGSLGSSFWSNLVLQCSQHESVVRQAVLALSSAYLDYTRKDEDDTVTGTYKSHGVTIGVYKLDWL